MANGAIIIEQNCPKGSWIPSTIKYQTTKLKNYKSITRIQKQEPQHTQKGQNQCMNLRLTCESF
jgi:hypothetical protein